MPSSVTDTYVTPTPELPVLPEDGPVRNHAKALVEEESCLPPSCETGPGVIAEAGPVISQTSIGDSFFSSVILLLLLTVLQKAVGFGRAIVVCRMISPEEMGLWAMIQTVINTTLPLVLLSVPACFGRYFERYRAQGRLRAFLWQASLLCLGLLCIGEVILFAFCETIAGFTLGGPELSGTLIGCGIALVPFAAFCFSTEMITALKFSRVTTIACFLNGISLAALSIGLLVVVEPSAQMLLWAFGLSHVVALIWMVRQLRNAIVRLPIDTKPLPFLKTWFSLTPLIFMFWLNDFMTNMFNMADRFMLVNMIPGDTQTVLMQVGNYESGHIIPVLLAAVTVLIAKTLMPYLAQAWEAGDRTSVSQQINLALKLVNVSSVFVGLVFLPMSGLLFETLFHGKYDGGAAILPYIVFFYVGCGTTALLMNYFWCANKAQWAIVAMATGVLLNITLNFALVPSLGIEGAAIGTAWGIACQVTVLMGLAVYFGLKPDRGVVILALASLLLLLPSSWAILWGLCLVSLLLLPGVLTRFDKDTLASIVRKIVPSLN